jgi:hypothetical protein
VGAPILGLLQEERLNLQLHRVSWDLLLLVADTE